MFTQVKTSEEIKNMRHSGAMLGSVLALLVKEIQPGMTHIDLAERAAQELKALGGMPAFLGYMGFPAVICVSVNDEVVHGIPRDIAFEPGDIVGLDFGVSYHGMITDSAVSVVVGEDKDESKSAIVATTEQSMMAGIAQLKDGVMTGDIGHAIEQVLTPAGYGIVRDLVGHGVGHKVHEEPNIPNFGIAGTGVMLSEGMTIAIEPMATMGKHQVSVDADHWTVRTVDGSLSAHFEHTVLITQDGFEILTVRPL